MKKLLALIIAALMLTVLASCGSDDSEKDAPLERTNAVSETTQETSNKPTQSVDNTDYSDPMSLVGFNKNNMSAEDVAKFEKGAKENGYNVSWNSDGSAIISTQDGTALCASWPECDLTKGVPAPEGKIGMVSIEENKSVAVKMENGTRDAAEKYVAKLTQAGFTVRNDNSNITTDFLVELESNDGRRATVIFQNGNYMIEIYRPEEESTVNNDEWPTARLTAVFGEGTIPNFETAAGKFITSENSGVFNIRAEEVTENEVKTFLELLASKGFANDDGLYTKEIALANGKEIISVIVGPATDNRYMIDIRLNSAVGNEQWPTSELDSKFAFDIPEYKGAGGFSTDFTSQQGREIAMINACKTTKESYEQYISSVEGAGFTKTGAGEYSKINKAEKVKITLNLSYSDGTESAVIVIMQAPYESNGFLDTLPSNLKIKMKITDNTIGESSESTVYRTGNEFLSVQDEAYISFVNESGMWSEKEFRPDQGWMSWKLYGSQSEDKFIYELKSNWLDFVVMNDDLNTYKKVGTETVIGYECTVYECEDEDIVERRWIATIEGETYCLKYSAKEVLAGYVLTDEVKEVVEFVTSDVKLPTLDVAINTEPDFPYDLAKGIIADIPDYTGKINFVRAYESYEGMIIELGGTNYTDYAAYCNALEGAGFEKSENDYQIVFIKNAGGKKAAVTLPNTNKSEYDDRCGESMEIILTDNLT